MGSPAAVLGTVQVLAAALGPEADRGRLHGPGGAARGSAPCPVIQFKLHFRGARRRISAGSPMTSRLSRDTGTTTERRRATVGRYTWRRSAFPRLPS